MRVPATRTFTIVMAICGMVVLGVAWLYEWNQDQIRKSHEAFDEISDNVAAIVDTGGPEPTSSQLTECPSDSGDIGESYTLPVGRELPADELLSRLRAEALRVGWIVEQEFEGPPNEVEGFVLTREFSNGTSADLNVRYPAGAGEAGSVGVSWDSQDTC